MIPLSTMCTRPSVSRWGWAFSKVTRPVRRPPRVPDARCRLRSAVAGRRCRLARAARAESVPQRCQVADRTHRLDAPVLLDGHAGRVIAAVLQALQTLEQDLPHGRRPTYPMIPHTLASPSLFDRISPAPLRTALRGSPWPTAITRSSRGQRSMAPRLIACSAVNAAMRPPLRLPRLSRQCPHRSQLSSSTTTCFSAPACASCSSRRRFRSSAKPRRPRRAWRPFRPSAGRGDHRSQPSRHVRP